MKINNMSFIKCITNILSHVIYMTEMGRHSVKDNVLRTIAENPEAYTMEVDSYKSWEYAYREIVYDFEFINKVTLCKIKFQVLKGSYYTSLGKDIDVYGYQLKDNSQYGYKNSKLIKGCSAYSTRRMLYNRVVLPYFKKLEAEQKRKQDIIDNKLLHDFTTIQVIEKINE